MPEESTIDVQELSQQQCVRCGASVADADLRAGNAIRVLGRLICAKCVDSPPVKRSNEQGLPRRVYRVMDHPHGDHNRYTFITAAHLAVHRRYISSTGLFPAPPLPADGSGMHRLPSTMPGHGLRWVIAGASAAGLLLTIMLISLLSGGDGDATSTAAQVDTAPERPTPSVPTVDDAPLDQPDDPAPADPTVAQRSQLSLQLATIAQALDSGDLDRAEAMLADLEIPNGAAFEALSRQQDQLRSAIAAAKAPADPEPEPTTALPDDGPSIAALSEQFDLVAQHIADGELELAGTKLNLLETAGDPGLKRRQIDLRGQLARALTARDVAQTETPVTPQPVDTPADPDTTPQTPDETVAPTDPGIESTDADAGTALGLDDPGATPEQAAPEQAAPEQAAPAASAGQAPTSTTLLVGSALDVDGGKKVVLGKSDDIPDGLPLPAGPAIYASRSTRGEHDMRLACTPEQITGGGVNLLLHRGDDRRDRISIHFADAENRLSRSTFALASDDWQAITADPATGALDPGFDPLTISQIIITDVPQTKARFSFLIGGAVLAAGAPPRDSDLPWRKRHLLPLDQAQIESHLKRIMTARRGKKINGGPVISTRESLNLKRVLLVMDRESHRDRDFRDGLRDQLVDLTGFPKDDMVRTAEFDTAWLEENLSDVLLDDRKPQVAIFCFRGIDLDMDREQAFETWQTICLHSLIRYGCMPMIVLGPMKGVPEADRQTAIDSYYPELIDFIEKKCGNVPVIDLRDAALTGSGHWKADAALKHAQIITDSYRLFCEAFGTEFR